MDYCRNYFEDDYQLFAICLVQKRDYKGHSFGRVFYLNKAKNLTEIYLQ